MRSSSFLRGSARALLLNSVLIHSRTADQDAPRRAVKANPFLEMIPKGLPKGPEFVSAPPLESRREVPHIPTSLPECVQQLCTELSDKARMSRALRRQADKARTKELFRACQQQDDNDLNAERAQALQEAHQRALKDTRQIYIPLSPKGPAWDRLSAKDILAASVPVSEGAARVFTVLFELGSQQ